MYCSSRTLQLSSLDLPGTERPLTLPFAFTEQRPDVKKIVAALPYMKPFDTLPRCLIPSRRYAWRPPRMLYGWPAPRKVLMDYARKRRVVTRDGRQINYVSTFDRALGRMIRGDGVANIDRDYCCIKGTGIGAKDSPLLLVSVYTNYDLKRRDLPSDDIVEKIGRRLGIEGPPKWYLDGFDWCWQRW